MIKLYKKRILIVGAKEKTSLETMYYKAFKTLGLNISFLQIEKNTNSYFLSRIRKMFSFFYFFYLRKKLIKFIKANYKQFDIVIVFKAIYLDIDTLVVCKSFSKKILWVNIFTDDPFNTEIIKDSNNNILSTIKYFDFFCIYSYTILRKLKKVINSNKLIYLPFGHDRFSHFASKNINKSGYKNIVTFFGTLNNERAKFLSKVKKVNISVYGNNSHKYKKIFKDKHVKFYPAIQGAEMRNLMSKSLVSINILRKQNKNSHNMKTFEIPAMNCLMLTTRSKEQNDFYPENKACLMYSNVNEFNKKINYIKNNANVISKIRSLGYKISKKYSYTNRAINLLNEIYKLSDLQ